MPARSYQVDYISLLLSWHSPFVSVYRQPAASLLALRQICHCGRSRKAHPGLLASSAVTNLTEIHFIPKFTTND